MSPGRILVVGCCAGLYAGTVVAASSAMTSSLENGSNMLSCY